MIIDKCADCKFNTKYFVCHPHYSGCNGESKFISKEIKENEIMADFFFECNEECNCCFDGELEQCDKYGECFYCYYSDNCNNQSKCIMKG